jgi:hypothetical protein
VFKYLSGQSGNGSLSFPDLGRLFNCQILHIHNFILTIPSSVMINDIFYVISLTLSTISEMHIDVPPLAFYTSQIFDSWWNYTIRWRKQKQAPTHSTETFFEHTLLLLTVSKFLWEFVSSWQQNLLSISFQNTSW